MTRPYISPSLQVCVAFLLVANFVCNAYETQMYGKLENEDGTPKPSLKLLNRSHKHPKLLGIRAKPPNLSATNDDAMGCMAGWT